MPLRARSAKFAATAAVALLSSATAHAASDPTGVWFDHNGRGAVEIKQCAGGKGLCGHVVYVKDPAHASRCGLQILGEVTTNGGGWIYSPERKQRFDVALKRLSDDQLRVVGNAGSRLFSKTFTWNRAPDGLERCDGASTAASATPSAPAPATTAAITPAKPSVTAAAKPVDTEPAAKLATKTAPAAAVAAPSAARSGSAALAATTVPRSDPAPTPANRKLEEPEAEGEQETVVASDLTAVIEAIANDIGSGRTCKFRLPYIGKTISVPCSE